MPASFSLDQTLPKVIQAAHTNAKTAYGSQFDQRDAELAEPIAIAIAAILMSKRLDEGNSRKDLNLKILAWADAHGVGRTFVAGYLV